MQDTFTIRLNGEEVARVTGDGITNGKKSRYIPGTFTTELIDDFKMLKMIRDGQTVLVFYVSSSDTVTVEKVVAAP